MRTILTHARLIDCVNPTPAEIRPSSSKMGASRKFCTGGRNPQAATHGHRSQGRVSAPASGTSIFIPTILSLADTPLADQVALFGHRLMAARTESGIVGFRCAGTHHYMDVAWKRAFDSGQFVGPRVYACGYFLTTTGGHFLTTGHALECDGPFGFVKAIREQMKNGVDHIS
jgi:hypothetical protein